MSEAKSMTTENVSEHDDSHLVGKGRYGCLVRNGHYSRRKGDWQEKDFEVGVSIEGTTMRICWNSDEEDGLPRRRQVYLPADAVRAILNG